MRQTQDDISGLGNVGVSIVIDDVSKTYNRFESNEFRALEPVSTEIRAGEFVSVVGPSGCGKSTLLLMVAGLLNRTTGVLTVQGKSVEKPLTDIGIAFQDHLLLDFRTAMDNVLLQADIRHRDKAAMRQRAEELFEQLHLSAARDKYPRELSGGMRQRVSLIRSIVHGPALLLMDEPFGALDALTRLQVRTDLESLWLRRRPTVLFVTHSVEEAVGLSDRVIVMSQSPGQIVDDITIDIPRPRPLILGSSSQFTAYSEQIYAHFERMGVLHSGTAATPLS